MQDDLSVKEYFEEQDKKDKPIKFIISLFILFIFIISFIPYYALKLDPNPNLNVIHSIDIGNQISNTSDHIESMSKVTGTINIGSYKVIANKIATESCSESNVCYAKAMFYFVRDNIQYVSDPEKQYVQSPSETLISGGGDCEDKSILLAVLLEAIGMDADVGLTQNHAFVRVQVPSALWRYKSDEDYVYLDPSGTIKFGEVSFSNKEIKGFIEL